MALGDAYHGRKEAKSDELLLACLRQAGLPDGLLALSRDDPSYEEELKAEHQDAVDRLGAFGVPTLKIEGQEIGFFGPVVDPVPLGGQAVELWDHIQWELRQPYLWELKRDRHYRPLPQPLIEAGAA